MEKSIKLLNSAILLLVPLLLVGSSIVATSSQLQLVSAQTSQGTNSFSAAGYTGQILTLPPSITQVPVSQNESSVGPSIGSVIGGNWSFTVSDGNLQNFTWNAVAYSLAGKPNGTASITGFTDAKPLGSSSDSIALDGNSTSFAGTANLEINGETAFENVPVALYLLNGNIVSLTLSQQATNGQFSVPLYGIVTSLTQQ
ncbi:hypothetical protein [Candidatus Nitrosocosmicus sp. SS]|jgi:hypothetical protein|uniref:hypothetical protein n=1 Tax=Candidatus Nitrosocosmicus agrestis TaxID=2563600 RepID=UPI00122E5764|nr:hypothetical protein [Candidatus Nitrosocosmicus sp. SS]KAA2283496.1 hypothetical protein F1Z66_01025 [Candidatus Nitrosocosmicus sp. SS]KAF0869578.1 hypothetical protein E5N71_03565 [Candidatus Nitrosocosmicus sp. SS]